MNFKKTTLVIILFFAVNSFSQITITEIVSKEKTHFISTKIGYPVLGTYYFDGAEPIVELNENGTGYYQLHDQLKRPINWGIECFDGGIPKFIKGFDSAEYTLWYQYTDAESDKEWNWVELSIHFKTKKIFIQGERMKPFVEKTKK